MARITLTRSEIERIITKNIRNSYRECFGIRPDSGGFIIHDEYDSTDPEFIEFTVEIGG